VNVDVVIPQIMRRLPSERSDHAHARTPAVT